MADGYVIEEIMVPFIWFDPSRIENDLKMFLRSFLGACAVDEGYQDVQKASPTLRSVVYNIISITDDNGFEIKREYESINDTVEITSESNPIMIVSYNCTHNKAQTARELAMYTHMFFKNIGKQSLEENEAVLVELSPVQNRSTYLINEYVHQFGFDVTLRTKRIIKDVYEKINTVEVNINGETINILGDSE